MNDIKPPAAIELTAEEQSLFDAIDFSTGMPIDYDAAPQSLANSKKLTRMLIDRDAIPEIRLKWFTDEKYNPGGYGSSRYQWIQRGGTTGDDVFALGNFPKFYLWYFVKGPDLPKTTIDSFCKTVNEAMTTDGGMMTLLQKFTRAEVRNHRLGSYAAEEFYKLAIETGQERYAETIRKAAMSVR